jgi:hypothetical protein
MQLPVVKQPEKPKLTYGLAAASKELITPSLSARSLHNFY